MEISVELLDGSLHIVVVEPCTTVAGVKRQLADELDLMVTRFDLTYGSTPLAPKDMVVDCGVSGGDTLVVEESTLGTALRMLGDYEPTTSNMIRAIANRDQAHLLVHFLNAGTPIGESLLAAVREHNYDAVVTLTKRGADVNRSEGEILCLAVALDDPKIVEHLLMNGADPTLSPRNRPIIHSAKSVSVLDLLLTHGANINTKCPKGYTILYHPSIPLEDLIERGADVNAEAKDGTTPLFWTESSGIELLVQNGAKVDHKNDEGYTPLFKAVRSNDISLAASLVKNGASAKVKKNHRGVLFWSMSPSMTALLLKHGADSEETAHYAKVR